MAVKNYLFCTFKSGGDCRGGCHKEGFRCCKLTRMDCFGAAQEMARADLFFQGSCDSQRRSDSATVHGHPAQLPAPQLQRSYSQHYPSNLSQQFQQQRQEADPYGVPFLAEFPLSNGWCVQRPAAHFLTTWSCCDAALPGWPVSALPGRLCISGGQLTPSLWTYPHHDPPQCESKPFCRFVGSETPTRAPWTTWIAPRGRSRPTAFSRARRSRPPCTAATSRLNFCLSRAPTRCSRPKLCSSSSSGTAMQADFHAAAGQCFFGRQASRSSGPSVFEANGYGDQGMEGPGGFGGPNAFSGKCGAGTPSPWRGIASTISCPWARSCRRPPGPPGHATSTSLTAHAAPGHQHRLRLTRRAPP